LTLLLVFEWYAVAYLADRDKLEIVLDTALVAFGGLPLPAYCQQKARCMLLACCVSVACLHTAL